MQVPSQTKKIQKTGWRCIWPIPAAASRPDLQKEFPRLKMTEITKKASERFTEISDVERAKWQKCYTRMRRKITYMRTRCKRFSTLVLRKKCCSAETQSQRQRGGWGRAAVGESWRAPGKPEESEQKGHIEEAKGKAKAVAKLKASAAKATAKPPAQADVVLGSDIEAEAKRQGVWEQLQQFARRGDVFRPAMQLMCHVGHIVVHRCEETDTTGIAWHSGLAVGHLDSGALGLRLGAKKAAECQALCVCYRAFRNEKKQNLRWFFHIFQICKDVQV